MTLASVIVAVHENQVANQNFEERKSYLDEVNLYLINLKNL
jgi:hypothetical protein